MNHEIYGSVFFTFIGTNPNKSSKLLLVQLVINLALGLNIIFFYFKEKIETQPVHTLLGKT